jgi:citryl-CoA lyase
MEKQWKTSIAQSSPEKTIVRGYDLDELILNLSFTEMIYLTLTGKKATPEQVKVLNAMLVSATEHGINPPSISSARIVASGGNSFNTAVGAGVLSLGESHGGAIDASARVFQERVDDDPAMVVDEFVQGKKRFPGFGHKIYTTDPRTQKMFALAKENGVAGKHVEFALAVEEALEKAKGRKLCLNVDGAIAALLSDMDVDWKLGKAFFIIPRTVGICAHVHEELTQEKPFRRLPDDVCGYIGERDKKLH